MYMVIDMKKMMIWIFLAVLSGGLLGKLTIDKYSKLDVKEVMKNNNEVYMLKYKTYDNTDEMIKKTKDIDRYVYIEKENKVTVYLAVSMSKKSILKVKKIYDNKNIKLNIEKNIIDNDEFIQNLNEYEKLLDATDDENSLLIIERQILSCYEKIIGNDEKENIDE